MAQNYVFKESIVRTKKLVGMYDADSHIVDVDGIGMDVFQELEPFNGARIEIVVRTKDERDLSSPLEAGE